MFNISGGSRDSLTTPEPNVTGTPSSSGTAGNMTETTFLGGTSVAMEHSGKRDHGDSLSEKNTDEAGMYVPCRTGHEQISLSFCHIPVPGMEEDHLRLMARSKSMLSLMEKIPDEAESLTVLVGGVKFLDEPIMAFIRLAQVICT